MQNPYEAIARGFGFEQELTGGGCTALTRYFPGGPVIWITDNGGLQMPESDGDGYIVGLFDSEGNCGNPPVMDRRGFGIESYTRAIIEAINRAEHFIPTEEALAQELQDYCEKEQIPYDCAELLFRKTLEWREWLDDFCKRWDQVAGYAAMQRAIEARGA